MVALHLVVAIAGERVAIPTTTVESVIEVTAMTRVPRAAPHVVGLVALRGRVVTLVDCRVALGCAPLAPSPAIREAVVIAIDGHRYGLLVDAVEDVIEAHAAAAALTATLAPGWARAASDMIVAGETLLPCLDPVLLVFPPAATAA